MKYNKDFVYKTLMLEIKSDRSEFICDKNHFEHYSLMNYYQAQWQQIMMQLYGEEIQ